MSAYLQRVNAENLAAQAPDVQRTASEILEELKSIERCLYWALNPDVAEAAEWSSTGIEHAHALLDCAHAYRAALKANPPPKEEEE